MGWVSSFVALAGLDTAARKLLEERAPSMHVPAGAVVFGPGKVPEQMLLLIDGVVRVQQTSETGREIVLYRVQAGESCILTTACLLAGDAYAAEGIAETDLRAVAIPRAVFDGLLARSSAFRNFVFDAYGQRIADLILTIEDIAFRRLDLRLAETLCRLAGTADSLHATHQDLAKELGSAREVVSRQLAEFQRRGWTEQGRGVIRLLDRPALDAFAKAG
ncbi:MAG: Crp/Fnr family transcriptional regulator [Mangrovicoccus sp.]|nr:Crp/Fnr family transcriptional regulator [Mangrovicoccus sp.]